MPPISVTRRILSKWARLSGVSRTINTSRRRSLSVTSAARVSRLSLAAWAIAESVRMEQGATSIPAVRNEPLAMPAARLPIGCTTSASACTSSRLNAVSEARVSSAPLDTTKCVSTCGTARSSCKALQP